MFIRIIFFLSIALHAKVTFSQQSTDCRAEFFRDDIVALHSTLADTSLKIEVLEHGLKGYYNLKSKGAIPKEGIITVIDFTMPSNRERMWVINLKELTIIRRTLVSHGMNTGGLFAQHFSNTPNTHKSSLGFYIVADSFSDKKLDLCIRLKGLEGSNSNAWSRGIIIHKAWYAEPDFMEQNDHTLGRSHGCPALPSEGYEALASEIQGGTVLFIYHSTPSYLRWSGVLRGNAWLDASIQQLLTCQTF